MKVINHIALALGIAAALTLTGCAGEAPPTEPKPTASQSAAAEEPTPTPVVPVVQKFGSPDGTFMEALSEAGAVWPDQRAVVDEADFDNWIVVDGIEIQNADACGEATLVHSGGEVALACESGRFFLKD